MSVPRDESSLLRSPELRVVLALLAAAGALLMLVLGVLAGRSDFLMLDFREWEPAASSPFQGAVRSMDEIRAYFDGQQPLLAEQRPFRLTLSLQPSPTPDVLAAGRQIPVSRDGVYCLRVLALTPRYGGEARVLANGAVAAVLPLDGTGQGRLVEVGGIRPRHGRVSLRFELRAAGGVPEGLSPTVHFEFATLRACEPEGGRP